MDADGQVLRRLWRHVRHGEPALIRLWHGSRPGRTVALYLASRGPLLARGMSYSALFSAFAALYVLFAVLGIVFARSQALRDAVVAVLASTIPGLIDTGGGGAVRVDALFDVQVLGVSGLLVLALLTFTASGWLRSVREGVRTIFGLAHGERGFVHARLVDLAMVIVLGVLMVLSAALSVAATHALELARKGLHPAVVDASGPALAVAGLVAALLIDVLVLLMLFRVQARIPVGGRALLRGALTGALGFAVLKYLGAELASATGNNPLVAGFAVIIGLMLWFNLVMQWLLLTAAWIATGPRLDRG